MYTEKTTALKFSTKKNEKFQGVTSSICFSRKFKNLLSYYIIFRKRTQKFKISKVFAFLFYILKKFNFFMPLLSTFSCTNKKFKKDFLCTYFLLFLILSEFKNLLNSSTWLIKWFNKLFVYGNNFSFVFFSLCLRLTYFYWLMLVLFLFLISIIFRKMSLYSRNRFCSYLCWTVNHFLLLFFIIHFSWGNNLILYSYYILLNKKIW